MKLLYLPIIFAPIPAEVRVGLAGIERLLALWLLLLLLGWLLTDSMAKSLRPFEEEFATLAELEHELLEAVEQRVGGRVSGALEVLRSVLRQHQARRLHQTGRVAPKKARTRADRSTARSGAVLQLSDAWMDGWMNRSLVVVVVSGELEEEQTKEVNLLIDGSSMIGR